MVGNASTWLFHSNPKEKHLNSPFSLNAIYVKGGNIGERKDFETDL